MQIFLWRRRASASGKRAIKKGRGSGLIKPEASDATLHTQGLRTAIQPHPQKSDTIVGQDLEITRFLSGNHNERAVLTQDGDAFLLIQDQAGKGRHPDVALLDQMLVRRFKLRKTAASPIHELRMGTFIKFPNFEVVMLNAVLEPGGESVG
jgi:hypothetical protein